MTDRQKSKIPAFKTIEEEADFWDTHSFADYKGEMKRVDIQFKRRLDKVLPVRLDSKTVETLERKAADKGIGATTLIRMWVLERLQAI